MTMRIRSASVMSLVVFCNFLHAGAAGPSDQAEKSSLVTHLYTSWYGVEAGVAVFKVDPALVETVDDAHAWSGILHALGAKNASHWPRGTASARTG